MLTVRSRLSPPGEVGAVKFHGVDLLQHSPSPSPSPGDSYPQQPHSLELFTDTPHQNLPIRKTHSELDTTLPTGWFNCQKNISLDSVTGFFCNISINTFSPCQHSVFVIRAAVSYLAAHIISFWDTHYICFNNVIGRCRSFSTICNGSTCKTGPILTIHIYIHLVAIFVCVRRGI